MIADLAMQRALDRYHRVGIAGLSEEEKTLATIWCFESKVANGGFENFFRSAQGELASFAPAAFHRIGATRHVEIAQRANDVFGPGGVPADKAQRVQFLTAMPAETKRVLEDLEAQYYELGSDLDERIEQYLARQDGEKPH